MGILGSVLKDLLGRHERPMSAPPAANIAVADLRQQEGGSILCFAARSEGNALAELTKELMAPFAKKARRIIVLDVSRPDWRGELKEALSEPVWFAAAYFAVGQEISVPHDGAAAVNLWESAGIPFVRFYGDIPAYFPDRHVARFRNSINAYFDSAHAAFYRRWHSEQALSILLPPYMIDPMPLDRVDVESKLKGKMLFPKNGNSPKQLIDYWRMSLSPMLAKSLESLAEESIGREWIDREPCFDDRLIRYFAGFGIEIAAEPAVLCFFVAQLDDYVRRIKSTLIAEALLDLPVIIRGRFWEHVDFRGKRATYDPNSDMASTQALIDQAPAIVDMSPNTQHTPHDRIRRAIGRGTAFLTNRQQFLDAVMPSPERCSFAFERTAIQLLVEHYVEHPREAIELGLEQARILRAVFDEQPYVDSLLTAVQTVAFRHGGRPLGTQNFVNFPPQHFR